MAQTAAFSRLLQDAAVHCPGAIPSAIQAELFATVKDFLQQTNAWQLDINVAIVANTRSYVLTPTTGAQIVRLMNLWDSVDVDKRPVCPATMQVPPNLVLLRTPGSTAAWVATVSLYPVDPVDEYGNPVFPAWVLDKHSDVLLNGTLARMFFQKLKPYTDNPMGLGRQRLYLQGRAQARAEVLRAHTYATQAWAYPLNSGGRQLGA